jgi:hypothetical protein
VLLLQCCTQQPALVGGHQAAALVTALAPAPPTRRQNFYVLVSAAGVDGSNMHTHTHTRTRTWRGARPAARPAHQRLHVAVASLPRWRHPQQPAAPAVQLRRAGGVRRPGVLRGPW